jgi:hypothetical protein
LFRVEIWNDGRANLLGDFPSLDAAKRLYDRAKQDRVRGEIIRLVSEHGIVCEIGDADAIPVAAQLDGD